MRAPFRMNDQGLCRCTKHGSCKDLFGNLSDAFTTLGDHLFVVKSVVRPSTMDFLYWIRSHPFKHILKLWYVFHNCHHILLPIRICHTCKSAETAYKSSLFLFLRKQEIGPHQNSAETQIRNSYSRSHPTIQELLSHSRSFQKCTEFKLFLTNR